MSVSPGSPLARERTRVLLWTDTPAACLDAIEAAGLADRVVVEVLPRKETPSPQQRSGTEVLMSYAPGPGLLSAMPRLRWAQAMTAGVEGWLALPDLPPGLVLSCARGTHRESMPENIIGAMMYAAKPYAAAAENQRRRQWVPSVARPLAGSTLGILGLGAIGRDVARVADALGMRVIGTRRRPEPMPFVAEVLPPERTPEVLARADFVLLLLPATPQTEDLVDARHLAMMKPHAWLLNFGRGQLVRDDDLVDAVRSGTIAGAVLDVFRREPLPADHPFWTTPGILVLPHIGGPHPQRDEIVARLFVDNLARFLDCEPLREVVDRAAGY